MSTPCPITLANPSLWLTQGYLNGQWTNGTATSTFSVTNPATGVGIGTLPDMGLQDTQFAIESAFSAFKTWGKTTEFQRHALLVKLFASLKENAEDIAKLITLENGKPLADARGEVVYGSSFIDWFANEAIRSYGDVIPSEIPGVKNITIKQPVGVCGIITPWNFPLAMVTRKVGAALAAGCTVVIKAPSETPYTILAFVALAEKAGIPKGVINVVLTEKSTAIVGKELCENKMVKKVSFTGSTRVGKILMAQSSNTLKKLSMELGGNAPFIIFEDADLDAAVKGVVAAKFRLAGQTCVCANRIFVHSSIYTTFAEKLATAVRAFVTGNGAEAGVTHGPLIHANAVLKVAAHVDDAVAKGAKVLVGGKKREGKGHFYEPTVLVNVERCAIDEDETFGPVAALYTFETEEEVIERANEPAVGLSGYFYTQSIARVARVSEALQVGMVGANTGILSQTSIPFGGVGESGFGREGSKYGLQEYQNIKLIAQGGF